MPVTPRRHLASLATALTFGLFASTPARAQPAIAQTAATAESLYDQASTDMDAGKFASACPKLEEVTRLIPEGVGAKLTLAECYEKAGRLASAWAQYTLIEPLATRAGQRERARQAAAKAKALKPRIAMLTVEVPAEVRSIDGLTVTRDGATLWEAQWGIALPIDQGTHALEATAPGRNAWKESVEVSGDAAKVTVEVKPLAMEVVAKTLAPPPPVVTAPRRPWQRPAALAAMGAGMLGVGIGATLGSLAIARNNDSNDGPCDAQNSCSQDGLDLRSQAVGLGNGSTIALFAGGALLAGGAVLWFMAPAAPTASKEKPSGHRVTMRVAVLPGGVRMQGGW
ncbi:tetratricopeptide repeat protein [Chondromyces apiculatus]|uniref:PEGA domain-containing protein n=1 Tax=Chondromyces apiculatus DSM 436 TaxID=1192034 RepID=A0A017SXH8_9BACT|nr:tetratricopeptide repeat protein [Chondromyces apiculatus]EYF01653.1 Hypothetical protein CAP_7972 [Chondromyces apiculatus DSM 436]